MRLTHEYKWKRTVEWLKLQFPAVSPVHNPASCPIHVHRRRLRAKMKLAGDTDLRGNKFYIRVNRLLSFQDQMETLLHEWAHAVVWFVVYPSGEDHHDEWGVAYARIYRAFIHWNYGRGDTT